MIYVDYSYYRKRDGKVCTATQTFHSVNQACRFIYSLSNRHMEYRGFSADTEEETYELINKL